MTLSREISSTTHPCESFLMDQWPHLTSLSFVFCTTGSIMSNEGYSWSTSDARTNLLHAESQIKRNLKSVWSGFVDFALRENVLEVAVGLMWVPSDCIYPRSIHKRLSKNCICVDGSGQLSCFRYPTPTFLVTAIHLQKHGRKVLGTQERSTLLGFKWLQYEEAGHWRWCCSDDLRVKWPIYGYRSSFIYAWTVSTFLDKVLNFIGMGVTLYLVASVYGVFSHDSLIKHTIKCPYCRKEISQKVCLFLGDGRKSSMKWIVFQAKRCPMCTSWLDGREDPARDDPTTSVYRD